MYYLIVRVKTVAPMERTFGKVTVPEVIEELANWLQNGQLTGHLSSEEKWEILPSSYKVTGSEGE